MSASTLSSTLRYPGFTSFKTLAPIYYPRRWMRMALIRATLDPAIIAVAPCPMALNLPPEVQFTFATKTDRGFKYVLVTDFSVRQLRLQDDGTFSTINRDEVLARPSAEVLRQVWTCSRVKLDPALQVVALSVLGEGQKVTIKQLVDDLGGTGEAIRQILAMVAQGVLQIGLEDPLTLSTKVWISTHIPISELTRNDFESWTQGAAI